MLLTRIEALTGSPSFADGLVNLSPSYAVARVGSLVAKDLRSFSGQSLHYILTNLIEPSQPPGKLDAKTMEEHLLAGDRAR